MEALDAKINRYFPGLVVRKDLVKAVKGNAIVPTYVLEYLLGQYCATDDDATMQQGIESVRNILATHYVHRNEAGLVRSRIKERGRFKVIDKISVDLNDKKDAYEASFANLGLRQVPVVSDTVKAHPRLLVSGVWCIADVEYAPAEDKSSGPWKLAAIKPIQLSRFDFDGYLEARHHFSAEEWVDVLIQSMGFHPALLGRRSKLTMLVRLVPFCERNYNLMELGPKGTGKSHIYSEFSPHGILISGGDVTVPKLFVNNATGKIGLVGYWDCVAFDEFAGRQKNVNKALVDIMKNYMANKSFSRGVETLGAEASMVFVGNTQHTVPYMLKHADLFCDLPEKFYDSAFLDRLHCYVPGWEMDIIRGEMFSQGYGFVVDYLAEILSFLRNQDYSDRYQKAFSLGKDIATRDRDGIHKTFSGLMKLLYPGGEAGPLEMEEILRFAMEGRKRVKDQLLRIDSTYDAVRFAYTNRGSGQETAVTTLEEETYPEIYLQSAAPAATTTEEDDRALRTANSVAEGSADTLGKAVPTPQPAPQGPTAGHRVIQENQKGISYDALLGPWLQGARDITVTDPYIRTFPQIRNFMEFMETVVRGKSPEDECHVHLVTGEDSFQAERQRECLTKIQEGASAMGITLTWEIDSQKSLHARHIITDTGWKISLDRGLDIFQRYEMNDIFNFANRLQQCRPCKLFEVTYIRI